jgi:hypothetical protein
LADLTRTPKRCLIGGRRQTSSVKYKESEFDAQLGCGGVVSIFHTIGETAGEIWRLLKGRGPLSVSAIVSNSKRPQATVYMGIGWLAREDKLIFTQARRGISLSLKK